MSKSVKDIVERFPWLSQNNVEPVSLENLRKNPEFGIDTSDTESYYNIKNKKGNSFAILHIHADTDWYVKIFGYYWLNLDHTEYLRIFQTWYNFGDNFDMRTSNLGLFILSFIVFIIGISIGVVLL